MRRSVVGVWREPAAIGLPVAALFSRVVDDAVAPELTPAGRFVLDLPEPSRLEGPLAPPCSREPVRYRR
jgi:hypothetical protein